MHKQDSQVQSFGSLADLKAGIDANPALNPPLHAPAHTPADTVIRAVDALAGYEVPPVSADIQTPEAMAAEFNQPATIIDKQVPVAEPVTTGQQGAEASIVQGAIAAATEEKPTLEATLAAAEAEDEKDPNRIEMINMMADAMQVLFKTRKNGQGDKVKSILSNVTVDIDAVQPIRSDNPLSVQQQLQVISTIDASPSFPVIALKSGYRVSFKALNNNEKIAVRNFRGTPYDQTVKLLKLVYSKIAESSVGTFSFNDFLRVTADEDYETLLYGIYYPTFPAATEYTIQCPHCQSRNNVKLLPDTLIEVVDQDKAGTYVADVLQGVNRGKDFLANSMVAKTKRIILPKSRIIIELLTPTLQRMLDNMTLTTKFNGKFEEEIIVLNKYIKSVMIPNVEAFNRGVAEYFEVSDIHQILPLIAGLDADDLKVLNKGISDRIRQYRVQYRIPAFTCASDNCKKPIENIDVDITSLLFFAIAAATSV